MNCPKLRLSKQIPSLARDPASLDHDPRQCASVLLKHKWRKWPRCTLNVRLFSWFWALLLNYIWDKRWNSTTNMQGEPILLFLSLADKGVEPKERGGQISVLFLSQRVSAMILSVIGTLRCRSRSWYRKAICFVMLRRIMRMFALIERVIVVKEKKKMSRARSYDQIM